MVARLAVSLSGLSDAVPESLARGAELAADLDRRTVALTHLLRPRTAGGPVPPGGPLVRWLHDRRGCGDLVALHGYDHTADPLGSWTSSAVPRLGRRAEFAALPRHEAGLRLTAARRVLARVGLATGVFVPPRWLASPGTVAALSAQGFAACADETGVRLLGPTEAVVRARVLGFRASADHRDPAGDRRAPEAWRLRVFGAEVVRTARRGGLVRIAVRAKDLRRPARYAAVLAAVDVALELGARPVTYDRLAAPARAA
jgi:predicted deacetylase